MRRRSLLATTTLLLLTTFVDPAVAEDLDPERIGEPEMAYYDTGFEDVGADHVFAEEIAWLAGTGISTGYERPDGFADFRPSAPVLREQMAAFLYRFASEDAVDTDGSSFTDIDGNHAFFQHVEWLAGTGITTGYENRTFRGSQPVLREQMAAFLWRYAGSPDVPDLPRTSPFRDVATNHAFYEAVVWLATQGVSTGYEDGTFRPSQPVLREQMAAFLSRLDLSDLPPLSWLTTEAHDIDVSDDGRWVVFASSSEAHAQLAGTGSNGDDPHLYLWDREQQKLRLVARGNYGSENPRISGDGRYVVWSSRSNNLVGRDIGAGNDVFLYDAVTGLVTMVNRVPNGQPATTEAILPSISADGSTITMWSGPASAGSIPFSAYAVPRAGGAAVPIPDHTGAPIQQYYPQPTELSADGSVIAPVHETDGRAWVWVHGATTSSEVDGTSDGSIPETVVSADGSEVLFHSSDRTLDGASQHSQGHYAYARDVVDGSISRVEDGSGDPVLVDATSPLLLTDAGDRLAFVSGGGLNLVDRESGDLAVISRGLRGEPLRGRVYESVISGDGSTIVFISDAPNLQPMWIPKGTASVYVWDRPSS